MLKAFLLLLLLLCLFSVCELRFLSQYIVTEGFSAQQEPSHVFFYNGILYATISIENDKNGTNVFPTLNEYNSAGQITNQISFPLNCTTGTRRCTLSVNFIDVEGSNLYALVTGNVGDGITDFHYSIFQVDLISFTITNEVKYTLPKTAFYPSAWLLFNSTLLYEVTHLYHRNASENLDPLHLSTLSRSNGTNPSTFDQIVEGGANEFLANQEIILLCGGKKEQVSFELLHLPTNQNLSSMIVPYCGAASFLGNSSLFAFSFNDGEESINSYLQVVDLNNPLPDIASPVQITSEQNIAALLADNSNVFISSLQLSLYENSTIYQYNVNSEGDFKLFDSVRVPHPYKAAFEFDNNVKSNGIDPVNKQVAFILITFQNEFAIYVLNYDDEQAN